MISLKRRTQYTTLNLLVVLVVALCLGGIALRNTSLFVDTLFEREGGAYQPYIHESFEDYDDYSEVLNAPSEDLRRWSNGGVVTAWADVTDWRKIQRVDLKLTDASGASYTLPGVENLQLPREANALDTNDAFADHDFNCPDQPIRTWADFMLINGNNFLFWEFTQPPPIDMSRIVSWQAIDSNGKEVTPLADVVIHDGVCRGRNSLGGEWYTPNGLPQYGVWWPEGGRLIMRKVEREQYPSNGDHTRILSLQGTPENFILRVRFSSSNIPGGFFHSILKGSAEGSDLSNTYIRVGWDFDNEYDPGHDQTLVYSSFEYDYLGLQRVFPVIRYYSQGYEPDQNDQTAKARFSFENGRTYELQVKVEGQRADVEVYEMHPFFFRRVAKVQYEFAMPRPEKSLPFSFEATGNVDITVDEIEVKRR